MILCCGEAPSMVSVPREMSSISASISRAKNSPMPRIVFNSFTLALVIARIVASDCLIRTLMSSMNSRPRSIWMRSISEALTFASWTRPALPNRSPSFLSLQQSRHFRRSRPRPSRENYPRYR